MILKSLATVNPQTKFRGFSETPLLLSTYHPSLILSNLSSTSLKCHCSKNEIADKATKGFSALPSVVPWETGSLWSTLSFYMFNFHIPLGYGGMSIIAYILHQPVLDPQTQALSLFVLESLELTGTFLLLRSTLKPKHGLLNFYKASNLPKDRNWLLASALGFTVLIFLVFLTSILADRLYGTEDVNNPILKEMLLSSDVAKVACVLVYCIIAPLLEETVYRGFLLRSLACRMNWQHAVVISATIFSAAHFSGENFLQLFIIGCVLGCSYCWTGDLSSSIMIHSLYNALTLMMSFLS